MTVERLEVLKESDKSKVYLVFDTENRRMLVEKHLRGQQKIYQTLQTIHHPYLPRLYDVRFEDGETVVTEEYITGGSLRQMKANEAQISKWLLELCQVLAVLHGHHILHRDIKPSNLLLGEDGHIRLIDFDAARQAKEDAKTDTQLLGTRGYAPPEQYGFAQTDQRADVYAVGVTWKALLGDKAEKPPYCSILRRCTNLNPAHRYSSVRALARAWRQRTLRRFLPLVAAGAILVGAIAVFAWYRSNAAEINQSRYPDEELLLYSTQGDYIIAKAGDLRDAGQVVTMEIDVNEDGHKETFRLGSRTTSSSVAADFTTGTPVHDGVYVGMDFLDAMNIDVPLGDYIDAELGVFPRIPDEYLIQITCLDLDPYSHNGKEILVSVGDRSQQLVTAVYVYESTPDTPMEYRGYMWGSTVVHQLVSGAFSAPLLPNPYGGYNSYTYSNFDGVSGNTVDYGLYQAAVGGELSLEEWHYEIASRDKIRE